MRYRKGDTYSDNQMLNGLRAIVFGTLFGVVLCVLCLLIASFAFVKAKTLPLNLIQIFILIICAFGAFWGGYITVRISKIRGMFYGMLSGLLLFAIQFVAGMIVTHDAITFYTLVKLFLMLLLGAIGGIVGVNKKSRRK